MKTKSNNKNTVTNLTLVPTSGPEAFAAIQPELATVPDSELIGISIDIPYAHSIALAAADKIDMLMPELEKLYDLDLRLVRNIRVYATACRYAHMLNTAPERADPLLGKLLEEASTLRENLLSQLETLAQFGFVSAARVVAIRAGAGHIDTASDLEQLAIVYREIWDAVKDRIMVTDAMVKRALELAQQLFVALGVKRIGPAQQLDDPQKVRLRAYTLFVRAYHECQRGVAYLRARHGDADQITPSIYVKQRKRSAAAEPEPEQPEAPAEPTAPEPIVTPEPVVEPAPTA